MPEDKVNFQNNFRWIDFTVMNFNLLPSFDVIQALIYLNLLPIYKYTYAHIIYISQNT